MENNEFEKQVEETGKTLIKKEDADAKIKKAFMAGLAGALGVIVLSVGLFFAVKGIISVVSTISDSNAEVTAVAEMEDANGEVESTSDTPGEGSEASQQEVRDIPSDDEIHQKIDDIEAIIDAIYYEEYDEVAIYDEMYKGMLESLGDPYSDYFTPEEFNTFMESSSGSYEGIGVVVSFSEDGDEVIVVAPFEGSPGDQAGMRPNDVIKEVDGISLYGMSLEEAVTYIKGEKGTAVELTIYRPSTEETLLLTIIRDEITEETVYYEALDNEMGYIRLTGFQSITDEQFDDALDTLEADGIDGLIIDLRNNPGGSLDTVINISDRLLGEALIVYTEDKYGERNEYFSDDAESFDKPIVVLVNEYSASASEILSGALKDLGVGTLVGNTTYGKGLVQNIIPLEDGSAVKLTIARYYTPSGNYINQVGIEPDVQLILDDEQPYLFDTEKEEDLQLQLAIEVLGAAIGE